MKKQKRAKAIEKINAMKPRNYVVVIALGRNGGPHRSGGRPLEQKRREMTLGW
jgi:hypothetical protein